jgi:hypothetical protein
MCGRERVGVLAESKRKTDDQCQKTGRLVIGVLQSQQVLQDKHKKKKSSAA